ncbi:uncharacterized protein DUF2508 [Ruminiclostridium sufflavum DSM 19573]|uniref:Uncharacterized protein DUF2508 n=1 Tax=Ruminiclostridium sufflavum DSM 19573 TaxID=1121337 RepID=A0A318XMD0_9FIRM|nr:DUF2508 family protein [Ruminiclostridium sufflavum]PYG89007.1 uncharacterized protein DUF2508 [Ruminiclostridium sufflavum DSM 19573]
MEISLDKSISRVVNAETDILEAEKINLLSEIKKVKCDLADAYNNFNFVSDTLLVDYYTYQIKTFEVRYEYLIKLAKSIGLNNI